MRRNFQGYGIPSIVFMMRDGRAWPNLYFFKGGSKEYLKVINSYIGLKKDPEDASLWHVPQQNSQAFQQSMYELNLFNEQREDVMKKFLNQPLQSTWLGLSKVTSILKDKIDGPTQFLSKHQHQQQQQNSRLSSSSTMNSIRQQLQNQSTHEKTDEEEMSTNLMDSLTSQTENIHSTLDDGYEMLTKVDLGPMPQIEREQPVKQFNYDYEGRVQNYEQLRQHIFKVKKFFFSI